MNLTELMVQSCDIRRRQTETDGSINTQRDDGARTAYLVKPRRSSNGTPSPWLHAERRRRRGGRAEKKRRRKRAGKEEE